MVRMYGAMEDMFILAMVLVPISLKLAFIAIVANAMVAPSVASRTKLDERNLL